MTKGLYDNRTSVWASNRPIVDEPPYVYPSGGTIVKSGASYVESGTTLARDEQLFFPARGSKHFNVGSHLYFLSKNLVTGGTINLTISGTNPSTTFSGYVQYSASVIFVTANTATLTFINAAYHPVYISGTFYHGNATSGIGYAGVYWSFSGGGANLSGMSIQSGSRLDWYMADY